MRAPKISTGWLGLVFILGLVGCGNDPEETCKDICEATAKCNDASVTVNCESDDAIGQCKTELEKLSDDCQSAAADYADCLADVDSCSQEDVFGECGSEAGDLLEACAGEEGFLGSGDDDT